MVLRNPFYRLGSKKWRSRKADGVEPETDPVSSLLNSKIICPHLLILRSIKIRILLTCMSIAHHMATLRSSNLDRAVYRSKCRKKLSEHICKFQPS